MMEVFAGFLQHTDHYLGELVQFLKDIGEYDNTVIMLVSDNGASAEGGPTGSVNEARFFNNVPDRSRKAWRASTKSAARSSSTTSPGAGRMPATPRSGAGSARPTAAASTDPFIVTWPSGITARGELRSQYAHVIDMVPTVLDALARRPTSGHRRRHAIAD